MKMTKEIIEKLILWEQDGNSFYALDVKNDQPIMLSSLLQIGAEYENLCFMLGETFCTVLWSEINQHGNFLYNCYEAVERDQKRRAEEAYSNAVEASVKKSQHREEGVA